MKPSRSSSGTSTSGAATPMAITAWTDSDKNVIPLDQHNPRTGGERPLEFSSHLLLSAFLVSESSERRTGN
jgi:hypothetical protein